MNIVQKIDEPQQVFVLLRLNFVSLGDNESDGGCNGTVGSF